MKLDLERKSVNICTSNSSSDVGFYRKIATERKQLSGGYGDKDFFRLRSMCDAFYAPAARVTHASVNCPIGIRYRTHFEELHSQISMTSFSSSHSSPTGCVGPHKAFETMEITKGKVSSRSPRKCNPIAVRVTLSAVDFANYASAFMEIQ